MTKITNKKVALGLSGGVDSAVSAVLLIEQGYDVTGVYIECWNEPGCRAQQDRDDALKIALKLNIPFKELDFKKEYKNEVMSYFLKSYKSGQTPNPDVMCNNIIKFGLFYDWAIQQNNFDYIATGHYAQIIKNNKNDHKKLNLSTAKDFHKDQTYFLHQLKSNQLQNILFPLGEIKKEKVRQLAHINNLHIANKKDSVGICFVGQINVKNFLKQELGEKPGDIIDKNNNIIGTHNGLWFYTIGQRQGFKIDTKLFIKNSKTLKGTKSIPPLYVIGKNKINNQIIVGLKTDTLSKQFNLINLKLTDKKYFDLINQTDSSLFVRIRHTGKLIKCYIKSIDTKKYQVILSKSVEGIAEGQFAVFYKKINDRYICLGGGTISN